MTVARGRFAVGAVALAMLAALAPTLCHADEIAIEIAPSTLNLASSGNVVTVHTDVLYGDVDVYSVYLAGVAIDSWKADDRGYFVAKFLMDDVKTIDGLQLNALNTLRFVGLTVDGAPVWGEAEVMVIDRGPRPAPSQRPRPEVD
jgi:hypothetical protein